MLSLTETTVILTLKQFPVNVINDFDTLNSNSRTLDESQTLKNRKVGSTPMIENDTLISDVSKGIKTKSKLSVVAEEIDQENVLSMFVSFDVK